MNLFIIILLILLGTFLVFLEVFLLPGGVVGIIGVGLSIWGIYESFQTLGPNWGWIVLIGSILANSIIAWWAFNNMHKSRFAVKEKIDGRVNEFNDYGLKVGEVGIAISDIRPEGRAQFGDHIISIWSFEGRFISANQEVKIEKISDNKIFVSTLNTI